MTSTARLTPSLRLGWNCSIFRKQIRCSRTDTMPMWVLHNELLSNAILNSHNTALELAKHNITVNCYAPGIVVTQMGEWYPQSTVYLSN